ncbi:MAG: hypothetical protein WKF91_02440, partial [Segetibacter sp.]
MIEDIKLKGQHEAGIINEDKNLVLRKVQSDNSVPAIIAKKREAITTLLDCKLSGGANNQSAIINNGHLYARNIETSGYSTALQSKEATLPKGRITEYVTGGTVKLFEDAQEAALNLPIKEVPDYPWPEPNKWAVFDVTKQGDDTKALQKLIDSGVEQILINGANERLHITGTIHLRGKLKRLHGGWTNMLVENKGKEGQPLFHFHTGNADFMIFEAFSNGQQRNNFTTFFNESNKTVVIRDVFMGYGINSYRNTGHGELFLESVVTGGGDYPEQAENKVPGWLFKHQHVWFRNLNPEEWVPDLQVDEEAVVFGIGGKLGELYGTHLKVVNGARAEMFGIMCNANMVFPEKWGLKQHLPSMTGIVIEVEDADLSLGVFHDGNHNFPDTVFIKETRKGITRQLKHSDARSRFSDNGSKEQ